MGSLASLIGRRTVDYRVMVPDSRLVLPDCLVGIEMELEGDTRYHARTMDHGKYFVTAKEDGSLRNGGIEMIFSEPLMGDAVITALEWMFKVKQQHNLVGSIRTSTHMHINYSANSDTAETLINTVVAWLLVEKAMCLTAGHHREYNSFCVPTYMMNPREENLVYSVAAIDVNDTYRLNSTIGDLSNMDRYAALNLSALFKYGTLECRLLGTAEYQPTLDWLNILLSIKKAAINNTRDELLSYPTLLDFLNGVMPGTAELLVIDSTAEQHYTNARNSIVSMLAATSVALDKRPLSETFYQYFTTTNTCDSTEYVLTEAASAAREEDEDELFNTLLTVMDDRYWSDNTVLGVDAAGWDGPSFLNSTFNFERAADILDRAVIDAGFRGSMDVTQAVRCVEIVLDNAGYTRVRRSEEYAMRYFNLLTRFPLVNDIRNAYPNSVNL